MTGKLNPKHFYILLALALSLSLVSCGSTRYPYKKPRRKRNCDCPRWSYQPLHKIYYYQPDEPGSEVSPV